MDAVPSPRDLPIPAQTSFSFVVGDSRQIVIQPTELLFIDTLHDYEVLLLELFLHSPRVKKFIALHDTQSFGSHNESGNGPGLSRLQSGNQMGAD